MAAADQFVVLQEYILEMGPVETLLPIVLCADPFCVPWNSAFRAHKAACLGSDLSLLRARDLMLIRHFPVCRFVIELVKAVVDRVGAGKTGERSNPAPLSPFLVCLP